MVTAAMAWCDGFTAPLLVPLNGWLQPPLPLQIRTLSCPQGVKLVEAAPSGQHVIDRRSFPRRCSTVARDVWPVGSYV